MPIENKNILILKTESSVGKIIIDKTVGSGFFCKFKNNKNFSKLILFNLNKFK